MNPVLERKPWDVHSGIFAVSAVCLGKRTTAVNGKRKGSLLSCLPQNFKINYCQ